MKKLFKGIVLLAVIAAVAYFGWNWWASKNENIPPVDELVQHITGKVSFGDTEEDAGTGLGVKDVMNLLGNEKVQEVLGEVDIKEVLGSLVSGDGEALSGLTDKLENISLEDLADMGVYDIDEQSMFEAAQTIHTEELVNVDLGDTISVLDLNMGGGVLKLTRSGDAHFYLSGKDYGKMQYVLENGTLKLVVAKSSGDVQSLIEGQMELAVPEGVNFKEVSMEVAAGAVSIDRLGAEQFQLNLSMGNVSIGQLNVNDADMNVSMGNLEVNLEGGQSDYDYKVSGAMGKILLGNTEYSGAASGEKLDNGTGRTVDVECSIGNVTVGFTR